MCRGVGWSGLPMLKSITSSPRRRAASFSSPVTLKTYGGRRLIRANSSMARLTGCGGAKACYSIQASKVKQIRRIGLGHSMKLHLAQQAGLQLFTGYGAGYVAVNNVRYERGVLVTPQAVSEWAASGFAAL